MTADDARPPAGKEAEGPPPIAEDEWRDPDVVFGREPRLSDSGDRRLRDMRSYEPRLRFAWVKIAIMVTVLVGLLLFYGQISDKAAGCYQQTAGLEAKPASEPRPVQPPQTHGVQIRIEPAPASPKAP